MAITEQWYFLTGMNHGKEILPLLRLLEVGGGMTVTEVGMLMCTMDGWTDGRGNPWMLGWQVERSMGLY